MHGDVIPGRHRASLYAPVDRLGPGTTLQSTPLGEIEPLAPCVHVALEQPGYGRNMSVPGLGCLVAVAVVARLGRSSLEWPGCPRRAPGERWGWCDHARKARFESDRQGQQTLPGIPLGKIYASCLLHFAADRSSTSVFTTNPLLARPPPAGADHASRFPWSAEGSRRGSTLYTEGWCSDDNSTSA